jgi:hypothetical protein
MCWIVAVSSAGAAVAKDAYYDVPLRELKLVEGSLPVAAKIRNWQPYELIQSMRPYATVDGQGEAYVMGRVPWQPSYDSAAPGTARLLIRAPRGKDVAGRLIVPNSGLTGMVSLRFTVPSSAAKAEAKTPFCHAKIAHYESLFGRDIPDGAWFRHQVSLARAELRLEPKQQQPPVDRRQFRSSDSLAETYDLFTGGRAMSENLQLDRVLPPARPCNVSVSRPC